MRIKFNSEVLWKLALTGFALIVIIGIGVFTKSAERTEISSISLKKRSTREHGERIVHAANDPRQVKYPRQHVYYLKTHKTGSTTLFTILGEYCRTHDLMPLLPRYIHFNHELPLKDDQILFAENHMTKYDMIFNHHIFTPQILSFLHKDTFRVTTIREPFTTFVSAFNYYTKLYNSWYLKRIPGEDPLMEFLLHHSTYEVKGYHSHTNNRQSMDLGYNISHSFDDVDYINKFIKETENTFNLVIITEYFDEGLVLLKRALNWKTEDIVYLRKNSGSKKVLIGNHTSEGEFLQRKLHARFSRADIMLYQHFLDIFKQKMSSEHGLQEEVLEFRNAQKKTRRYCKRSLNTTGSESAESLIIEDGVWSNGFQITPLKCRWLYMKEISMTFYLQLRQHAMINDRWWRGFTKKEDEKWLP